MSNRTFNQAPETAVALLYDGEHAPRITAKGRGALAERIFDLAEAHGIPLENDPELAEILSQVPLGDEIPENLYLAIAEVIAFAYLISGRRPPGYVARQDSTGEDSPERGIDDEDDEPAGV